MGILAIGKATELKRVPMGRYVGVLLGNVESIGMIDYGHVFEVIDPVTRRRVYAVAAERNMLAGQLGGGSHFICGYDGPTHLNYGSSDDWADRDRFLTRAIELAREHLKLDRESPYLERIPGLDDVPERPRTERPRPVAPSVSPATPSNRPSVPAMLMTLAGTGLIAANSLAFRAGIELPGLLVWLIVAMLPAGLALFGFGCLLTRRDGLLRIAGLLALVGLGLSVIKIAAGQLDVADDLLILWKVSSISFFVMALGFHAAFLMRLANDMGLTFGVRGAMRLMVIWGFVSLGHFYATWMNHGSVPHMLSLATLGGYAIWSLFHIIMTAKAARN